MLYIKNNSVFAALLIAAACLAVDAFAQNEFDILGRIESVRKDGTITLLFETLPGEQAYYIINQGKVCGRVDIVSLVYVSSGTYRYRAVSSYRLANRMYADLIRAGTDIGLVRPGKPHAREFPLIPVKQETAYRKRVISKDHKEMVLIPSGKFVFGSDRYDSDESPEQVIDLSDFYMDKYEVSNGEYKNFIERANRKPPLSWKDGGYNEGQKDLPVMVTYYEALSYAQWAGKRLPTEEEWEKAARGRGRLPGSGEGTNRIYPWGNAFDPGKLNCAAFWESHKIGERIKLLFNVHEKGLMPVTSFDPEGASVYGVVNMAGNAREWTSSWYVQYKGNESKKGKAYKKYGTQYKVVRGGSWYSPRYLVRTTSREIGGVPNLHNDNLAGFRCVREALSIDMEEK